MQRSTKRLVSVLICLALTLAMLPVSVFAAATTKVFCQAPDTWTKCYIHYWGSGDTTWPGVEMSQDEDGIWFYDVPSDVAGLVINNGNGTQSNDMSIPTDENVMYLFAKSTWLPYGRVDVETEYFVAGTASLCAVDWQPGAVQNRMTLVSGIYSITYSNVPAGTHKFKVTNGTWDQSWGKDGGSADYVLDLTESTNTVEILFDPAVPSVEVVVNGAGHEEQPPVDNGVYYVAGDFNGWNAAADGYRMSIAAAGVYEYTMELDAGDYELKVTDGTWALSWGDTASLSGNYEFTVDADNSTVNVKFEFATQQITLNISAVQTGELVLAEGTSTFATDTDAWDIPFTVEFVPAADGVVTIEITDCDPGYWIDVYANSVWTAEYMAAVAQKVEIPVKAGIIYGFDISSADCTSGQEDKVAGSVTYKITSDVPRGSPNQGENPGDGLGSSETNPQPITSHYGNYIDPGQTVWFIYDNYEHMIKDQVYSQMLNISASVSYAVTYNGTDVPADDAGFVVYEMHDSLHSGKYVISVTNKGSTKAYFTIEIKDRPNYVVVAQSLTLGDNVVMPSPDHANTLYEFTPDDTGVYTFTVSEGVLGNWGTVFNPVDLTATKSASLQWTCTAKGQNALIGVADTDEAVLNVKKTGEYVPENDIGETVYQNTYGFTYQLPQDPELVAIDVLDDKTDVAVLDKNGFYRYGSQYGPLMVTNLKDFPINLEDAILNGQLRAYVYDNNGKLVQKNNYNDAMTEYLDAELVPVTEELAMMLKQLGDHHDWWKKNGFVFEAEAPSDEATAWMVACSYIKGSELAPDDDNQGSGTTSGGNQGGSGNGSNPKTTDFSVAWAAMAIILAGTCLVVLKKKESFFLK